MVWFTWDMGQHFSWGQLSPLGKDRWDSRYTCKMPVEAFPRDSGDHRATLFTFEIVQVHGCGAAEGGARGKEMHSRRQRVG